MGQGGAGACQVTFCFCLFVHFHNFKVLFCRDPVVESYSLSCDSPVLAMTLDNERILCGLLNAQV